MSEPLRQDETTSESLTGSLLIATPLLLDPNFYHTVVYIAEHSAEGALGLVLNRPTEAAVADHLPAWAAGVSNPAVVFVGGPVATEVAVGVVADPQFPPDSWSPSQAGVGLVDLTIGPEAVGSTSGARVYAGYSGWVGGQLEMELATGSWIVAGATPGDVFTAAPDSLWRAVLRRQPGRTSLYAWFPDDIRSN